ncbi:MAG: AI-2E family transporter [Planctomycetota bacterium]|nr:AI-2E family transporter [Planctomycetota bacterium]
MSTVTPTPEKTLPPPWDRIFSLGTRTFVWALLIATLYLLRPFLLLIFLTFVFAYIQAHGVDGLSHRIKHRALRVTIVGLVFLGTLFATGFTLVPKVSDQATEFAKNKDTHIAQADRQLNTFLLGYPSIHAAMLKHKALPDASAILDPGKPILEPGKEGTEPGTPTKPNEKPANEAGQDPKEPEKELHFVRDLVDSGIESWRKNPLEWGQSVLGYASAFLLSLLFSFLIVLDLPKISRGIAGLSNTKIGFIYDEVADNIAGFGRVLGRALEAQLFIAICNTILTAIGIWMLGLENLLVLSTIVFFCSFIPVVGTFLSSTPICLMALQAGGEAGGVTTMVLAILLICIIHALETYVLNPQIYGHHMHMNPVLVLIVLTIGGKLFGVWGLLLGIPIVNYVFRHAIRRPEERPAET